MAEYEVFLWGSLIANERVVWGQAVSAFVREARKAQISDDQIRYVLELDGGIDVDPYSERLRSEAIAHVLRHEKSRREMTPEGGD